MKSGCECCVSTNYSVLKLKYIEHVIKADCYVAFRTLVGSFNI